MNREREEWTPAPGHTSNDAANDVKEHQVIGAITVMPWSHRCHALESFSSWRSVVCQRGVMEEGFAHRHGEQEESSWLRGG
jgi:hypothetical protein